MKQKRLTSQQKVDLLNEYQNSEITGVQLAKKYGITNEAVYGHLNRAGIKNRNKEKYSKRFSLDENFFERVDTEEKAYFLGFLYADGCNKEYANCVSLELQFRDSYIIDVFNKAINSDRKPYFKKRKKENHSDSVCLSIINKKFSLDLVELGCVRAKSLILKFPTEEQVPKHLQRHFIRGCFDGDGGIDFKNKACPQAMIRIASTNDFCQGIAKIVKESIGIEAKIYKVKANDVTKLFTVSGNKKARAFMDWLYNNSGTHLRLSRKYEKYQTIKVGRIKDD